MTPAHPGRIAARRARDLRHRGDARRADRSAALVRPDRARSLRRWGWGPSCSRPTRTRTPTARRRGSRLVSARPASRAARRQHGGAQARRRPPALSSPACVTSAGRCNWCSVGGRFTPDQMQLARRARHRRPRDACCRSLDDRTLAAVYRRAALVVAAVRSRRLRLAGGRGHARRDAGRRQRSPGAA